MTQLTHGRRGWTAARFAVLGALTLLALMSRAARAQNEAALRAAFEGRTVTSRIDMPATSQGIDVNPLEPVPVSFREVAERLKQNGTAIRIGQQVMITKVVVREWYIELQLGGGGYGTFSDMLNDGSDVSVSQAGETSEERRLRAAIKATANRDERKRLERELDERRSARERDNSRARAEAQHANAAREGLLRAKRAESGSRFNIRYRGGFSADGLTEAGVVQALAPYLDFGGPSSSGGIAGLRKGQTLQQVEALLGPAAAVTEAKEGTMVMVKRTYRRDGMQVVASFTSGVLVDFVITPM